MFERSKTMLPHARPECVHGQLLLFGIRRVAAGGLHDAHAAHAFFVAFGLGFRRPLVLLRTFMAESAQVASAKLLVAPCCCPRMTHAEAGLLAAITIADIEPATAHAILCDLLNLSSGLNLVDSAKAVSASFADHGMPLT